MYIDIRKKRKEKCIRKVDLSVSVRIYIYIYQVHVHIRIHIHIRMLILGACTYTSRYIHTSPTYLYLPTVRESPFF